MTSSSLKSKWWLADLLLVASLVPLIPQVMDLFLGNLSHGSGAQVKVFTLLALASIACSLLFLWLIFRTQLDKVIGLGGTLLVLGLSFFALAVANEFTENHRPAQLAVWLLFVAIFPAVAVLDYYLRKKGGSIRGPSEKINSGARLFAIYLVGFIAYLLAIFLFTAASHAEGGLAFFWDNMGESWIRPLYSMVLPFHTLMVVVLTVVAMKPRTISVILGFRMVVLVVQFWLCHEAFDLVMYYWW